MVNRELDSIAALAHVFDKHGKKLYLVGGSVRDEFLGRPTVDFDLATDAEPQEIKRLAALCHPDSMYTVGEKFGTIGLIFDGQNVEITTFRAEWYVPESRKPRVRFGSSLIDDLARRDLTINAMAQNPLTGEVIDPFGGLRDLRDGVIRAVGNPEERFTEDPLRLLRAIRFAAELGFRIDSATRQAIVACHQRLRTVSMERILDELNRIMLSPQPGLGIRLLADTGLLGLVLPEVMALRGIGEDDRRHKDVFEHTLAVVDNTERKLTLRWAALLHDIGKPATRTFEDRTVHFYDHDCVGAEMAKKALARLRMDSRNASKFVKLVRLHMRANLYDSTWTDSAVRRLIREAGDELDDLIALSGADVTSRRSERVSAVAARVSELRQRCYDLIKREHVQELKSPLDGHQLMALFQHRPGPWIREVKDYLLAQVLDGKLAPNDVETAAEMAKQLVREQGL